MIPYTLSYFFIFFLCVNDVYAGELTPYSENTQGYGTQTGSMSQFSVTNSGKTTYSGGTITSSLRGQNQENNVFKAYMQSEDKANKDIILVSLDTQKTITSSWSSFINYTLAGSLLGYLYSYLYPNRFPSWQCTLAGGTAGAAACAMVNITKKYPPSSLPVSIFRVNPIEQKYNVYTYKFSSHSAFSISFALELFTLNWVKTLPDIKETYSDSDYYAQLQNKIESQQLPKNADTTNLSSVNKVSNLMAILQADYSK